MSLCLSQAVDGPVARQLQSSVAQRCHTDALHCIFGFLSLKELLPALHSCRCWLAAGVKEPPRGLRVRMTHVSQSSVAPLVAPPLRHHVAEVVCLAPLCLGQLESLRALPRLTALDATLGGVDLTERLRSAGDSREQRAQLVRAALPPQLRSLTLEYSSGTNTTDQALMDALPVLVDLVSLRLVIRLSDVDLAPLLQLPRLSSLHLWDRPSQQQCAVLSQIATLTALDSSRWDRDALLDLLQPPVALKRLEEVTMGSSITLDPPLLTALLRLPALTALQPAYAAPGCWSELGAFSRLRSLSVCWVFGFSAEQRSALEESLNTLPRLAHLQLHLPSSRRFAAAPLNLRLAALRSLSLRDMRLSSLGFLQHSPRLQRLALSECAGMAADDTLRSLQTFTPRLRSLELDRCVFLSDEQQSLLRPASVLLPALSEFSYERP